MQTAKSLVQEQEVVFVIIKRFLYFLSQPLTESQTSLVYQLCDSGIGLPGALSCGLTDALCTSFFLHCFAPAPDYRNLVFQCLAIKTLFPSKGYKISVQFLESSELYSMYWCSPRKSVVRDVVLHLLRRQKCGNSVMRKTAINILFQLQRNGFVKRTNIFCNLEYILFIPTYCIDTLH